jgi:hypothetical protein
VSSNKLKAVRLLGKQPFDAIDEKDVAMVFLASFVLKEGAKGRWYWEIEMVTTDNDLRRFRQNAADRQLDSLKPKDAAQARQALLGIIERATERLTAKADAHRERARAMAALAPDFLAFDATPDGERLRRFDLASGRALARTLNELRKHRRDATIASDLLSVVRSPLSVVSGQLSVAGCNAEAITEAIATNEPAAALGNVTNEPNDVQENATNEPTEQCENATNEPKVAAHSDGGKSGDGIVSIDDPEKAGESYGQGVERRKAMRAESLRKLNEEAGREAACAMGARRAYRGEQRSKNCKPGGQLEALAAQGIRSFE